MPPLRAEPKVGIGVIIIRNDGKILIGKRKGSHAPYWSIPGGHLDIGESFEQAATREIYEETGLIIKNPPSTSQPTMDNPWPCLGDAGAWQRLFQKCTPTN